MVLLFQVLPLRAAHVQVRLSFPMALQQSLLANCTLPRYAFEARRMQHFIDERFGAFLLVYTLKKVADQIRLCPPQGDRYHHDL